MTIAEVDDVPVVVYWIDNRIYSWGVLGTRVIVRSDESAFRASQVVRIAVEQLKPTAIQYRRQAGRERLELPMWRGQPYSFAVCRLKE